MKKIVLLIMLCPALIKAQPYDFTIGANNGCSPLTITITNITADSNAYIYEWIFIGPKSVDTLVFWDTLTTTFTQTFVFSGIDTGNGTIQIYFTVFDSSGTYLGNNATSHEVDVHASLIIGSSIPDTCFAAMGEAAVSGCCGNQPYSYLWFNGSASQIVTGLVSGTYGITMTDAWGCTTTDSVNVGAATFPAPSICLVTVDSSVNKNIVIWEEQSNSKIVSYNIYKETSSAGVYALLGNNPVSALSEFIDTTSNPAQVAARYKISNVDSCGTESPQSQSHKTIHLVISLGIPPAINLSWDNYEGISFNKYYIWRGDTSGTLSLIDSVQSTLNSYTDLNPPSGTNFYAIEVIHPQGCNPTLKSPASYNSSFSNIAEVSGTTGVSKSQKTVNISVIPNPTNGKVTISGIDVSSAEVYNLVGEKIYSSADGSGIIDLSSRPDGIYFITAKSGNDIYYQKLIKQ